MNDNTPIDYEEQSRLKTDYEAKFYGKHKDSRFNKTPLAMRKATRRKKNKAARSARKANR